MFLLAGPAGNIDPPLMGVWIQAATALITALAVIASIWIARSGQKHDLKLAKGEGDRAERADAASQAAAERAEAASRLSIDTLARIADSLEVLAEAGPQVVTLQPEVSTPPAKVAWSLRHYNGDTYQLENVGTASAFDVALSADETLLQSGEWARDGELKAGEAINFIAARSMATRDSTITVKWKSASEIDVESWRYPLPPRPPRR